MKTFNFSHIVIIGISTLSFMACNKPAMKATPKQGVPEAAKPDSGDSEEKPDTTTPDKTSDTGGGGGGDTGPVIVEDETALFKECNATTKRNIVGDVVIVPKDTKTLPNFDNLKVISQVCLEQFNIKPQALTNGFPGATDLKEWYAINFKFQLDISKAGEYAFSLNSDDGSALYIDGSKDATIDNQGLKPFGKVKTGKISMTAGKHDINVRYLQGAKGGSGAQPIHIGLELKWKGPGDTTDTYLPLEAISRP